MTFKFKTKPYKHQLEIFEDAKDRECYALFAEQGTGKSKIALDVAAYLHDQGKITAMVIVSPSAVAPNWRSDEVPTHCAADYEIFLWQTNRATTKWHKAAAKAMLDHRGPELRIISLSYDALRTESGLAYMRKFLAAETTMLVIDESARIKSPSAKRTGKVVAMGKLCKYRWVMSGTPVSNGPFDVYSQLRFLDDTIWDSVGSRSYAAFRSMFGVFKTFVRNDNGRSFEKLLNYRNLDILARVVDSTGARVLKEDVLDLPPKLYSTRYFDMSPAQSRLYTKLKDDFLVELNVDDQISAPLMITRMLRLQQITSGYVPLDDDGESAKTRMVVMDPNPRMAVMREILEDLPHQAIVWGKFRFDIDLIMNLAKEMGITAVRYDGSTSPEDREEARAKFKSGEATLFVANPSCAGEGLTLVEAKTVIYYNNSFKLSERLQSEDRAHRIGQDTAVHYIDIAAVGTIDATIIEALRTKMDLSNQVTGDRVKEWI